MCVINAILHRYKIKHFEGINFRGIDLLVLLKEIFVQVLIIMYLTPIVTVTGTFLISATPSVRWCLLAGGSSNFKDRIMRLLEAGRSLEVRFSGGL